MKIATLLAVLLVLLLSPVPGRADGGLVLEAKLAADRVEHEGTVAITVRFANRGERAVRLYQPPHAGAVTFPLVRLIREGDAKVFAPYDAPFQSMVSPGMLGALVPIPAGGEKTYVVKRDRFVPVDPGTGRPATREPAPLPPGSYTVRVSYEKADNRIRFNTGGFRTELRPVEGCFVGKLDAPALHLRVGEPTRPRIVISAPPEEHRAALDVTFENPLETELAFRGVPRLTLSSKMYGTAGARPALVRAGAAKEGETVEVRVPARGSRKVRIDLRALDFTRTRRGVPVTSGLAEIVPRGTVHLSLVLLGADGKTAHSSNGIFAFVPPPRAEGLTKLVVTVRLSAGRVKAGEAVRLTAVAANRSSGPIRVIERWAFPKEMPIRIEDATGGRPLVGSVTRKATSHIDDLLPRGEDESKVAQGLSLDGDRFEAAPGLTAADFKTLAPGEKIERTLDLASLLAEGFTPGRYRVRVAYRNLESGARLGFPEGKRAGTGIVWSEPVPLGVE
ncbi:MAG: hypothetical protein ACYTDY_14235 [Planctomycetota bacterium]